MSLIPRKESHSVGLYNHRLSRARNLILVVLSETYINIGVADSDLIHINQTQTSRDLRHHSTYCTNPTSSLYTTTRHLFNNIYSSFPTPPLKMSSTLSVPAHLNFITGNKNKLAEVQAILSGVIELRNENIDLVEVQGTVEQVTSDKARRAAEAVRSQSYII
jgi:hypothetical protein